MPSEVEILLKASDKASQSIKGVEGELKKLGGAGKTAEPGLKRAGQALGDLVGFAAKGAGVIAGAGLIIKKAFDLGEEGAAIIQTAESFDLLLEKVGAAPDLLEQLQRASKGTIDDMSLMSSTATLLAGTQGDLAVALADSTPRLLEIAKAAQKLNPALGDTTFLYDSLARGIKRASPLILDNLGIIVKVEDANQKYADSIGKTIEQLTLEDEKMALLNATLEAGDVMIDQVGGSTDSATDSFTRLNASAKNLGDTLKTKLAPFLADAADGANLLLTGTEQLNDAMDEHVKETILTTDSYADYRAEMERINDLSGFFIKDVEILNRAQYDARLIEQQLGDTRSENIKVNTKYRNSIYDITDAVEDEKDAQNRLKESLNDLKEIISGTVGKEYSGFIKKEKELKEKSKELIDQIIKLGGTEYLTDEQADQIKSLQGKLNLINDQIKGLDKTLQDSELNKRQARKAKESLGELKQEAQKLEGQIIELGGVPYFTAKNRKDINDLQQELDETNSAIKENAAAHKEATARILFAYAEQQAAIDGLTSKEIEGLRAIGIELGIYDQKTADTMAAVQEIWEEFIETGNIEKVTNDVKDLHDRLDRLPKKINIDIRIKEIGSIPPPSLPGGPPILRQHGGPVSAGGAYVVGERGPELFVPRSSGNIVSNKNIISQPVIIQQYINDASAAAMAFAEVQRIRHGRLNESMGAR